MNHRITNLAREYSTVELFQALIHQSAIQVTDMQSDFLHDKDLITEHGMPTKAKMIEMIVDQTRAITPILLGEDDVPKEYQKIDGESEMDFVIRALATEYLNANPELMKLEYQPR